MVPTNTLTHTPSWTPTSTSTAAPQTFVVTTTADSGPGSLRQALLDANATTAATITFDPTIFATPQIINLSSNLPTIIRSVTIDGPDTVRVTINAGNVDGRRVLAVQGTIAVTLRDLIITGGSCLNSSSNYDYCPESRSSGGGILIENAIVTIVNSTFSDNTARLGGSIANSFGVLTLNDTGFNSNSSTQAGGGIYNSYGTVVISNSTFNANSAGTYGGGIYNNYGTTTITSSTFNANFADIDGGGIHSGGYTLTVLNVSNSTFNANSADNKGGAIYNELGTLTLSNSTISANSAGSLGGGISLQEGTANLLNSIVAGNTALSDPNVYGTPTWVQNTLTSGDPLLAPLDRYGGFTMTRPPLPGSPAIDAGDNTICAAAPVNNLDQRGVSRPVNGTCDIGAVESRGFGLSITGGNNQSTNTNTAFPNPLVVNITSPFGEFVDGGVITFDAPDTGPSLSVINPQPVTIAGGTASLNVTANGIEGSYSVPASAAGGASVSFNLSNVVLFPGTIAQVSPSGNITSRRPTFIWQKDANSTSYDIQVVRNGVTVIHNQNYSAAAVCTTTTCSITPPLDLDSDYYSWWVRGVNGSGNGTWSGQGFAMTILPSAVAQISPSGTITSHTPTLTWYRNRDAHEYGIWIGHAGNTLHQTFLLASAYCNKTTCSYTPPLDLSSDYYTWWIGAYSLGGGGNWVGMSFYVAVVPGLLTQTAPIGAYNGRSPTFTWDRDRDSHEYGIWIGQGGTTLHLAYIQASIYCNVTTCSYTPALNLSSDYYTWWVGGYSLGGGGPWNGSGFHVTVTPAAVIQLGPQGTINQSNPSFTWQRNRDSHEYGIWIGQGSTPLHQTTLQANTVCPSQTPGSTCTYTPTLNLAAGGYSWWIGGYSLGGGGPWSSLIFTVQ